MSIQHKNFKLKDLKYKVDQDQVQQILVLQKKFEEKFTRDEQKKLAFSQKVDYVYNTSALEGNTFTYAETETLLSGITVGGHSIQEENEIINQKEAWEFTLETVFTQPKVAITENLIKDIHLKAGRDFVVRPGVYRDGRVKIGGTAYVPPKTQQEIGEWMTDLVNDFNQLKERDFTKAFLIHFSLPLIQPFFDGNKRMGRLMMNFILLQNSYPLLSVPVKIRKNYIDAILKGYETLDINDLIKLLSELLIQRLADYISK